ncbi:hypothetical protein PFNF135_04371 [Plasmodium falciparum NF135/5.C10]|uniref:Uncharacterized protein n=2 Tax=Plasmodium falciparum TaxID=5833 RepID=A0A024V2Q6_PLAFA|nr:hypothetical protein PFFVO_03822 [Plasmodium falciparum Vietnam Oak-Knoll (FVO)]ETW41385.1 hypothetical protein PFNF135_04371 [Plasmodium falciparum NF135/5.C10]
MSNIHKNDLYKHHHKKSYRCTDNKISSVKKENKKNLDKGRSDKKYSEYVLKNRNSENIFESVKRVESSGYKNNKVKECNVISLSNSILKKTSGITRFKNKLYKMIFKRNKIWSVISSIITFLGHSAIICQIIMFYRIYCGMRYRVWHVF